MLAAAAEARWAAIDPEVVGTEAMEKSYAGPYLDVLRIATVSHYMAIELRDRKGSERLNQLRDDVGYFLSIEICGLSSKGRTRTNKVTKTLRPDAENIAASLATIGNAFDEEGGAKNPAIQHHFTELFWDAVMVTRVLGIKADHGLKLGGQRATDFYAPIRGDWSDLEVAHALERVIMQADFLVVWLMLDEERSEARALIGTVAVVVSNFAYRALGVMCPKLPAGDIEPPPALEVLRESARKKTPRNPGGRAARLRQRMRGT